MWQKPQSCDNAIWKFLLFLEFLERSFGDFLSCLTLSKTVAPTPSIRLSVAKQTLAGH